MESSCYHQFHLSCLKAWENKSKQCPNCKQDTGDRFLRCKRCEGFSILVPKDQCLPAECNKFCCLLPPKVARPWSSIFYGKPHWLHYVVQIAWEKYLRTEQKRCHSSHISGYAKSCEFGWNDTFKVNWFFELKNDCFKFCVEVRVISCLYSTLDVNVSSLHKRSDSIAWLKILFSWRSLHHFFSCLNSHPQMLYLPSLPFRTLPTIIININRSINWNTVRLGYNVTKENYECCATTHLKAPRHIPDRFVAAYYPQRYHPYASTKLYLSSFHFASWNIE